MVWGESSIWRTERMVPCEERSGNHQRTHAAAKSARTLPRHAGGQRHDQQDMEQLVTSQRAHWLYFYFFYWICVKEEMWAFMISYDLFYVTCWSTEIIPLSTAVHFLIKTFSFYTVVCVCALIHGSDCNSVQFMLKSSSTGTQSEVRRLNSTWNPFTPVTRFPECPAEWRQQTATVNTQNICLQLKLHNVTWPHWLIDSDLLQFKSTPKWKAQKNPKPISLCCKV